MPKNKKIVLGPKDPNQIVVIAKGPDPVHRFRYDFKMKPVVLPDKPGTGFGIEETKDVVRFGVSFANAIIETFKDGNVSLGDIPNFIASLIQLPTAINGLDQVPAEMDDLDAEELNELVTLVQENLEVEDEDALTIVEKSIRAAYALYEVVKAVMEARGEETKTELHIVPDTEEKDDEEK